MQEAPAREDGESVLSSCNMDLAGAAAYVVVAKTVHEKMKVLWVVQAASSSKVVQSFLRH